MGGDEPVRRRTCDGRDDGVDLVFNEDFSNRLLVLVVDGDDGRCGSCVGNVRCWGAGEDDDFERALVFNLEKALDDVAPEAVIVRMPRSSTEHDIKENGKKCPSAKTTQIHPGKNEDNVKSWNRGIGMEEGQCRPANGQSSTYES